MRKDAALLAVLAACVWLTAAAPAHAGTYDVVACNVDGAHGQNLSWKLEAYNSAGKAPPDLASFVVNGGDQTRCSPTFGINFGTVAAKRAVKVDDGAGWTFRAPAGTVVRRVQIWRNTAARASTDDATTAAAENGWWNVMARAGDAAGGPVVIPQETCTGNTPNSSGYCQTGTTTPMASYEIGERVVAWGLQCAGPNLASLCFAGDGSNNHAGISLQAARVTVEDLVPPDLSPGLPATGVRVPGAAIAASATDSAGIRSLRVLVDGVERFAERQVCDYRLTAPCPVTVTRGYDLAGVADGRHTVTTLAEDAASNLTRLDRSVELDGTPPVIDRVPVSGRRISVLVSDALSGLRGGTVEARRNAKSPFVALKTTLRSGRLVATVPRSMSPSRVGIRVSASDNAGNVVSAVVTSMSLSTRTGKRFHKVRNARAAVPYGRAVTVAGRLTSTDGQPVAGQPVAVTATLRQTGAVPQPLTTVTTDAAGRFRFAVPAGPSRTLNVEYAGGAGNLRRLRTVALRVPASSTIRASAEVVRGAARVRFSGRLRMLGASLPPGGKIVELQGSQRGQWITVDTARAEGPDGAWRASARFRGNSGRFPIRLRIRREAVFPFELGYSPAVVIRVR